ncbi:uncharacterized protein [Salminus brasiliensis]|uniref:uncharacterized protein n=1 Tax=Salminus brasiliensis TaxID=930266 RepID=UPI003B82F5C5
MLYQFTATDTSSSSFPVNLLQPNISFSASPVFHWWLEGPEVTRSYSSIICSVQPQYPGGSFHLEFSGESSITKTQSAVNHSTTFSFPEADYVHQGNYSCVYEVTVSSRSFRSSNTELLAVTIRVNLLQPNISFSASPVLHWWLEGPEVTRSYSSIICSVQPQYPGGSFHLEFSGESSITKTQSAVNHSTTFSFPEADYVHQGNYSCVYEVTVSSRSFRSSNTELLAVTVKVTMPNTHTTAHVEIEMDDEDYYENSEDSEFSDEDYINKSNTIIKFADDTTVVGLISGGDETAYRDEVQGLAEWCAENNMNSSKTKELVIDLRRRRIDPTPLFINGDCVERVPSFRFLERCNVEHKDSFRGSCEASYSLMSCVFSLSREYAS